MGRPCQPRDWTWPRSCSPPPETERAARLRAVSSLAASAGRGAETSSTSLRDARKPRMSLRTRILGAVLSAVVVAVLLTTWVVNDRIVDGAMHEAQRQAREHGALTNALYAERADTLVANAEAVALYPAVIAAVDGRNAQPLARWSNDVTVQQQIHVKVFDASGATIAHGHTEARIGPFWDDGEPGAQLEGVGLALAGTPSSGVETSDEIGLALRGYAPVRRDGLTGPVVGAVMLADPLDASLLWRLVG